MEYYGWNFSPADMKLANDDGRDIMPGETLTVEPPIILCEHGLHASRDIMDALYYARGPILRFVRAGGVGEDGRDKFVSSEQEVLWLCDAGKILRRFTCDEALRVLPANADRAIRRYLETPEEWLREAAQDAARVPARVPARDAAWSAAWDAARAAARSAARIRQRRTLLAMLPLPREIRKLAEAK